LAAPNSEEAEAKLKLWAKYSDSDGGFLENVVPHPKDAKIEQTLVLLKPDNFRFPSARPGNIVAFDRKTEKTETVRIPTSGSIVRNMAVDSTRQRLWLALSGTSRIGKIDLR